MFPYYEFSDFMCSTNGPRVSYLLRESWIGFDCDFCYQNIGELPVIKTQLIITLSAMIIC